MSGAKTAAPKAPSKGKAKAPFGAENRQKLIGDFLGEHGGAPVWQSVYRLLLWVDKTTSLAHCYESDKCQPGKPWHLRSLRFHDWLARSLGVEPHAVSESIDWLFRRTADEYAAEVLRKQQHLLRRAQVQRAPYEGRGFPEPGEDPAIIAIIKEMLGERLLEEPTPHEWSVLSQKIRESIAVENKRKNLVGEGFEDVLAALLRAQPNAQNFDIHVRKALDQMPGFKNVRLGEKVNKVDLVLVDKQTGRETLITAKWSIRADREKQFQTEFASYVQARSNQQGWGYVLVTNEFDPARLARACEAMAANNRMFEHVIHINPAAVMDVYGPSPEDSMARVASYVTADRLLGLDDWLSKTGLK
ncbi:hypothetical protein [Rhizobacter sp. SG703]|uniref:hypothetical protein n=1 Tax=Rhizobacter sp. SG703 TaxID=2587140 RepID=UPI001448793F|nr:hypothetical protein [Rhizobacter sp. SG703]NKI93909.1 hypothetical protein [Rhizobacter sp. SG703]